MVDRFYFDTIKLELSLVTIRMLNLKLSRATAILFLFNVTAVL